jgi:glucose-1-phosphate cytidylyltransferase
MKMKVVILAGGLGTRISEESHLKPKLMIEIGDSPILWHILKYYSSYGFNEFIICCGYKGYCIKEYFADYYLHRSDVTFDFSNNNSMIIHNNIAEPWEVTVVDTGLETQTGGRIKKIERYVNNETFMLTYGDGVSNIDLSKLYEFHREHRKIATITAIQPGGRFGVLDIDEKQQINKFSEKDREDGGWINGGFMVLEPEVFRYIDNNELTVFEREPLENLAKDQELMAYKHNGFWKCMDTLRDKEALEYLCKTKQAPWIRW